MPKLTVEHVRRRFDIKGSSLGADDQWQQMRCEARYVYADAMIRARKGRS